MNKKQVTILILTCLFVFLAVYLPHYSNPFPVHIDEWHHLTEALKIKNHEYAFDWTAVEFGFHFFLYLISFLVNLTLNYQFLPAIWAIISALTLFYIVQKKTNSFQTGIFAMLFFASIKSNVNILGLWFFTPLTFSIPFIFLFIYFYSEGIEKQNKKYILASLLIMLILIISHSISFLFAIPLLIIYTLINYKYLLKEYKFFSIFLLIPIAGIFFHSRISNLTFKQSFLTLLSQLQFKYGWGVLELNNSPLELYSIIGFILAFIGILILLKPINRKKSLIYILWPIILIMQIAAFKLMDISYLSPYQRNLYYFAISLPLLSAIGLSFIVQLSKTYLKNPKFKKLLIALLIIAIFSLTFANYITIPSNIKLYKPIDKQDYFAIKFLKDYPRAKVLATPSVSEAIYPITEKHDIVARVFWHQEFKPEVNEFFSNSTCERKQEITSKHNPKYIISSEQINCSYKQIYNKTYLNETRYVYEV